MYRSGIGLSGSHGCSVLQRRSPCARQLVMLKWLRLVILESMQSELQVAIPNKVSAIPTFPSDLENRVCTK